MAHTRAYERLYHRYRRFFYGAFAIFLAVVLGFLTYARFSQKPFSTRTIAIIANPVLLITYQASQNQWTILSIPADLIIEAGRGYGRYSIQSLWFLDAIDRKDGTLLTQSLEDVIGLPIPQYVEKKEVTGDSLEQQARNALSLSTIVSLLSHQNRSNTDIFSFLWYWWNLFWTKSDRIYSIDFAKENLTISEQEPDGSTIHVLSTQRIDKLLETTYEDPDIRSERVSVAIYNTTDKPTLGSRAARMFSRLGGLVTTVGNQAGDVDQCQVSGQKEALHTKTAALLQSLFSCTLTQSVIERADLGVYLGKAYARRYLPSASLDGL